MSLIDGGLLGPFADRDRGSFELLGQALRRAAGAHQVHYPSAVLRWVGGSGLGHRGLLLAPKGSGVHRTGVPPHSQFRQIRKTPQGTYLVSQQRGGGKARELDAEGKVLRTFPCGQFVAIRLPHGNTLLACGDEHRVVEVDANDQVVWEVKETEIPGNRLGFVAGLQRLPNGNTVICNWSGHSGLDSQPQVFELSRDKKLIWQVRTRASTRSPPSTSSIPAPPWMASRCVEEGGQARAARNGERCVLAGCCGRRFAALGLAALAWPAIAAPLQVVPGTPAVACPAVIAVQAALIAQIGDRAPGPGWRLTYRSAEGAAGGGPGRRGALHLELADERGQPRLRRQLRVEGGDCRAQAEAIALIVYRFFAQLEDAGSEPLSESPPPVPARTSSPPPTAPRPPPASPPPPVTVLARATPTGRLGPPKRLGRVADENVHRQPLRAVRDDSRWGHFRE